MSLFIGFVPVQVSAQALTDAFAETFGASVLVRLSKEKVNKNNLKHTSATIDIVTSSRALTHFLSEVDEYGSNTFVADKNKYRVQYAKERERERERERTTTHVKPYIIF
jgi:hypothetical protein